MFVLQLLFIIANIAHNVVSVHINYYIIFL